MHWADETERRRSNPRSKGNPAGLLDQLPELRGLTQEEVFLPHSVIVHRGEAPGTIYVIVSGVVELSRTELGRKVGVQLLHPGDVIGDAALLGRVPHPFQATAVQATKVLSLPSTEVVRLVRNRPEIAAWWLESIAGRLVRLRERVAAALAGDVEERLATFLLAEAGHGEIRVTQSALAQLFGAHRSSVNRALKELEEAGLVTLGYSRIRVIDPEGLAHRLGKKSRAEAPHPRAESG